MEKILVIILVFLVSGCAVVTVNPSQTSTGSANVEHTFPSAEAIRKLMLGVSREEALALIGRTVTTGYELKEGASGEYQHVTVNNPSRSQKITKGNDTYQVDYYLTYVRKADGVVSDDELTPLVFQENKLIGKGWEFFNSRIKR